MLGINNMDNLFKIIDSPIIILNEHDHPLINSIYKERKIGWQCNRCLKVFQTFIPSFNCTKCDFHLCNNCVEMHKIGEIIIYKDRYQYDFYKIKNSEQNNPWLKNILCHEHFMALIQILNPWICNFCSDSYNNTNSFFYCSLCNYKVCDKCIDYIKQKTNQMQIDNDIGDYFPLNQSIHKSAIPYIQ